MGTEIAVFAKDFPELRLLAKVTTSVSTPIEQDTNVREMIRAMWGAKCHFGLLITPSVTYVLRDTFATQGSDSLRITDALPTTKLFERMARSPLQAASVRELELLAEKWLVRLAASYDSALPDDPDVMRAFFPDIVGAVADGRIVFEGIVA